MSQKFYQRLRSYYLDVAAVLRNEARVASIFPNSTDIGTSRERIYAEFLRHHAPSKCNVFFGGFLFGEDGSESGQLDVIVTTDTVPRFNFHNSDGGGKSFSPIEGTLGVASIKSHINKNELENALDGIAAIPRTSSLHRRVTLGLTIKNYDDWPYKIIYASSGIAPDTILAHLNAYYSKNSEIPEGRRPNIIHIAGNCVIVRTIPGMSLWDINTETTEEISPGQFRAFTRDADLQAIVWALDGLQSRAAASTHILYSYDAIINGVLDLPVAALPSSSKT